MGALDAAAAAAARLGLVTRDPAVVVRGLRFAYRSSPVPVLDGIDLVLPTASRTLVIGANGAGKSTLLRVIAGKHMVDRETVRVLGASAFHDTALAADVELLGGNFPFDIDLEVAEMLAHAKGIDPARRDRLIELLGVNTAWHMHAVSDGQRRRVQLLMGLIRPRKLLLLDEVTTDLDLLARQDLLAFLREETERGATILYATHIFDSLDTWATHVVYLVAGKIHTFAPIDELRGTPLLGLVESWLRRDTPKLAKTRPSGI